MDRPEHVTMSTKDAAEYLGIAPSTLEVWRCTGRYNLPFEKIGRKVVYRREVLDRWRAERTHVMTGCR